MTLINETDHFICRLHVSLTYNTFRLLPLFKNLYSLKELSGLFFLYLILILNNLHSLIELNQPQSFLSLDSLNKMIQLDL